MLPRLRHRPIRRRYHQDRSIYLRRSRDHVLDIVPVSRHVHMRVVPFARLVFHVRYVDGDPSALFFRRVVNLVIRLVLRKSHQLAHLGDRRCQRRLTMVYVPHRPHIQVGLTAIKFLLRHRQISLSLN
ncbi:MAG: hypothetical protein BWY82_03012 [Verrucomicrobia bacterium ADurb.Bin474]|nr:MAG: hypothetical protein BWY82_03012 [Verrucomicrobia bacterium ADurb.Bin474]